MRPLAAPPPKIINSSESPAGKNKKRTTEDPGPQQLIALTLLNLQHGERRFQIELVGRTFCGCCTWKHTSIYLHNYSYYIWIHMMNHKLRSLYIGLRYDESKAKVIVVHGIQALGWFTLRFSKIMILTLAWHFVLLQRSLCQGRYLVLILCSTIERDTSLSVNLSGAGH